jgi:acyl carrier protein phosphodiesterase
MNYLVNIYLSQFLDSREKLIGNFIGEFVKSSKYSNIPFPIVEGIFINNRLLSFMKGHPAVIRSRKRINPRFNKYSLDIVQLFYGHLLAKNWRSLNKGHETDYEEAVNNVYYALIENFDAVPYKLRKMLPSLISSNGLWNISTIGGLHNFIVELSSKGFCVANLQNSLQDLMHEYSAFEEDSKEFFRDFEKFAESLVQEKMQHVLAHAS